MVKKSLKKFRNLCVLVSSVLIVLELLTVINYSLLIVALPMLIYIAWCTLILIVGIIRAAWVFNQYRKGNSKPYEDMIKEKLESALKIYTKDDPKYKEIERDCNVLKEKLDRFYKNF